MGKYKSRFAMVIFSFDEWTVPVSIYVLGYKIRSYL